MPARPSLTPTRMSSAVAVAATALPVAVNGIRAAAGRWVPQGDDAYFTLRSLDVATGHHPLVGAWSSGSADIERNINNLGPLQLDLLAPFTRIAPMGGTAIGVATVHVAAIVTVGWLVRRIGGHRAVIPAMVAIAVLTWVMGSEMLITPRQHQYLLLPYMCVLVAAWAATAGDRWALVAFVAAGSLVTQTHLSYPILVGTLAIPVVVGQIVAVRATAERVTFRLPWLVAGATAAALWSQTVIDQLFGWGNLRAVLASPGETTAAGYRVGVRIVADVLVAPRAFVRPGFATYDPNSGVAGDLRVALFGLLWAGLAAAAVVMARSGARTAAAGLVVAVAALSGAVVDAAQLPVTQFGLTAANYRWLWPTAAFLLMGGLVAIERYVRLPVARTVPAGLAVALGALTIANLPVSYQVDRPAVYRDRIVATADLTDRLDRASITGPVVIDQSRMYFGHPFAYPLAVVLRHRGIEYRFEGSMQARRFGESRVSDGSEPTRLVLVHADEARAVRHDPAVVAFVDGPDPVAILLEQPG